MKFQKSFSSLNFVMTLAAFENGLFSLSAVRSFYFVLVILTALLTLNQCYVALGNYILDFSWNLYSCLSVCVYDGRLLNIIETFLPILNQCC